MKLKLLQVFFVLIGGALFGQTNATLKQSNSSDEVEKCSQHIRTQQMQLNDPARFATIGKRDNSPLQQYYSPAVQEKITGVIYTIPVVFHILHNGGSENISSAQVQSALDILTRDYRRLNSDANSVTAAFTGMPSDVEIEFAFAKVAPNGACFDGITRTQSTLTNNGSSGQNQVNAIIAGNDVYQGVWPHNKYLNIYIANDIGGAAGYTYLPNGNSAANATNMYYNGIFILENYTGSIGTSNVGVSRALTHEVGHWLNLPHTWGAGNTPGTAANCNGDDGVQDTPNCRGVQSCTLTSNGCNSDDAYWGSAMIDNVENYMDYSYCSKMFTQGQVDEMRAAMASNVGGRSNIWTTTNLQNVGVLPGVSLCSIDFAANQTTLCSGTTINYTPNTTTGISNYSWTFPGGTPSSSNAVNPTVTYSTLGTHNATLVVTSSSNGLNYTETKSAYITVNSSTTVNLPINEGFSVAGTPSGWSIVNSNSSATTWVRTTAAGNPGGSFMFDNANFDDTGDTDQFQVTKFSTVGMSSSQLTFDVAYAPYDASYYDGLEVLVSTDCGTTFTSVYSKSYLILATAPASTGIFTPTAGQWRNETIDLTPYVGQSSVLVSFKNLAGYGNRLFVDNVNITGFVAGPTANFNTSSSTACVSQAVTFTDASVNATSWNWNFGAGAAPASATGAGPHSVSYSSTGTKSISLTINGGSVSNQSVTVNTVPSTPSIIAGGATTFCAGGNVVLTSSSSTSNTWSNGATSQSITVNSANSYTVTVGSIGCSATSLPTAIVINPLPTVSFGALNGVCVYDTPFSLTGGAPTGGTYNGTGVSTGMFDPSIAGTGLKTLTYTYTDGNGCSNSQNSTISVNGCLSIDENNDNTLSIYPNPSTGKFTLKSDGYVLNSVSVFNQIGQLVYAKTSEKIEEEINLMNFESGVYTIRVKHASGVENIRVILSK
jgi:hypothetical protein